MALVGTILVVPQLHSSYTFIEYYLLPTALLQHLKRVQMLIGKKMNKCSFNFKEVR